ncbi:MAG: AAA family ATPase [Candidatus Lokiarchaeota archaeon]|nr:AAA family ATPase [Candidatus Lokiarchaeota archaeon]
MKQNKKSHIRNMKKSEQKSKTIEVNYSEIFTPEELSKITGHTIDECAEKIEKKRVKNQILSTNELNQNLKHHSLNKNRISLNSNNFNDLLGGGFSLRTFYFFYGEYATGKTQICHDLAFRLINSKKKDTSASVLYIDTEKSFRPERLSEIAKFNEESIPTSDLLNRIKIFDIGSTTTLKIILEKLAKENLDENYQLLVIDSLTNYIRADFHDEKKSNIFVTRDFKKLMKLLAEIKNKHNMIIVITGQVKGIQTKFDKFSVKPIMEYIINEYVDEIVYLYRDERKSRYAQLMNSTKYPEKEIEFKITNFGIQDP